MRAVADILTSHNLEILTLAKNLSSIQVFYHICYRWALLPFSLFVYAVLISSLVPATVGLT